MTKAVMNIRLTAVKTNVNQLLKYKHVSFIVSYPSVPNADQTRHNKALFSVPATQNERW